jgi:FkbM family methyltransferase
MAMAANAGEGDLLALAMQRHGEGRSDEAERGYRAHLLAHPQDHVVSNLLGALYQQTGRPAEAASMFAEALSRHRNPDYLVNYGNALVTAGQAEAGLAAYREAAALSPSAAAPRLALGRALSLMGRADEAILAYQEAVRLEPGAIEAWFQIGNLHAQKGRPAEAEAAYRAIIAVNPDLPEVWTNLGNALRTLGRAAEALEAQRQAAKLGPGLAEVHANLASSLIEAERFEEGIASLKKAISLRPDYQEALANLGTAYLRMNKLKEAEAACRQALAVNPDHVEAHCTLSGVLLLRGDFAAGWDEYEWRWLKLNLPLPLRDFDRPRWEGEDISGKTILLHHEQGLGDTLQFGRFILDVLARGAKVLVELPPALHHLFSHIPGLSLLKLGEPLPDFDVHCPLMSLPRLLGVRLSSIPAPIPYLNVDTARIAPWKARLPADGLRIGVVWQGKPGMGVDLGRSYPLAALAPVASLPGVHLISLQKNHGLDQLATLPPGARVETLGSDFDNGPDAFIDTAAVMASLDLVISSDTSVAHLAGALGVPVWTALKFSPDWRWLADGDAYPWYPSMRLFRQTRPSDWAGVFERMAQELGHVLAGDRARLRPSQTGRRLTQEPSKPSPSALPPWHKLPKGAPVPKDRGLRTLDEKRSEIKGRYGTIRFPSADRFIGPCLGLYGEWSEGEMEACRAVLREGDTVVEAGANIGAHTLGLARAVGAKGRVIAFEPQPFIFSLLAENAALNGLSQIEPHQAGVAAQSGRLRMGTLPDPASGPINFGGMALSEQGGGDAVETVSIDSLGLTALRLLKADIEGMEYEAIEGAAQTIARCRPVLYLENDRPERQAALIGRVKAMGYRVWWHRPALYSPHNFFKNTANAFPGVVSSNILCLPEEMQAVVIGMTPAD